MFNTPASREAVRDILPGAEPVRKAQIEALQARLSALSRSLRARDISLVDIFYTIESPREHYVETTTYFSHDGTSPELHAEKIPLPDGSERTLGEIWASFCPDFIAACVGEKWDRAPGAGCVLYIEPDSARCKLDYKRRTERDHGLRVRHNRELYTLTGEVL